jgi:radical SAM protein (TIGR01212 family)
MNNIYPWGHKRRFNSYSEYLKNKFGGRVQKLSIDAGFTCPNRDNSKGTGGCTYCNNDAFNPSYCTPEKTIRRQIEEGIEFHLTRYRRAKGYLAYFQAYSNTYAPLEKLKTLFEEALSYPDVIGLIIGTRPDCVDDHILDYLADLSRKTYVIVEYGIESCYNKTLQRINRGHDFETTVDAIERSHMRGIMTGGHIIIGLPGESEDEILNEIQILSGLQLNTIKFHQLQIFRGTKMGDEFESHPENFKLFKLTEYLELMAKIIGLMNPSFVVDRIAGESPPRYDLNPSWGLRYDQILVKFEKLLEKENTWQGKFENVRM